MTNENETQPVGPSKVAQTLSAFGAMLDLVSRKVTTLVEAITDRDPRVPVLTMQLRGALDVVEAGLGDVRRALDTVDGGA